MDASLKDRLRGMVIGNFLGDAASLGAHWIYNTKEIEATYPGGVNGFETPADGHYHAGKSAGDFTHYGDAAMVLLEALENADSLDVAAFGKLFAEKMDPKNGYAGYFDAATRGTLENYLNHTEVSEEPYGFQEGADDDQLATISALAIFVAFYVVTAGAVPADTAELFQQIDQLTRVRQNNDRAVAYCQAHARLLLELLEGRDIHSTFHRVEEHLETDQKLDREVRRKIKDAFNLKHKGTIEATDILGQSCPLICSFPSAVQATAKHNEDFEDAILETVRAGGDSAGRAAMIGAWIGARLGAEELPKAWIEKLNAAAKIEGVLIAWGL